MIMILRGSSKIRHLLMEGLHRMSIRSFWRRNDWEFIFWV